MRSFRRHRLGLLSRAAVPGAIAIGVVALALLLRLLFPGAFDFLAGPLLRAGDAASAAIGSALPEDKEALRAERDLLLSENATLRAENETLRERLPSGLPEDGAVIAEVLSRPPLSPYDTLVVALPQDSAAEVGALVYAEGAPIGKVASRSGSSARILLFSSAGEKTEGWVGEEKLPITLEGRGAGSFYALVPRESGIAPGATVYLPGPGAVAAGRVGAVEGGASSPEAVLIITGSVNPFSVTSVRILPLP